MAVRLEAIGAETAEAVVASGLVSFPEVAMRTVNTRARHSVPGLQFHVPRSASRPQQVDHSPPDCGRENYFGPDGVDLLLEGASRW